MKPQCPWPDSVDVSYYVYANKRINLQQLQAELAATHPVAKNWTLLHQYEEYDDGNIGGILWVNLGDDDFVMAHGLDLFYTLLFERIGDHTCDPKFGLDPFWRKFNDLQARVIQNPDLDIPAHHLQTLVKGLVLKSQFPLQEK